MNEKLRKSGIEIIGDVPWGTYICQFYGSKEDLAEILIPYFKIGLENNEFCLWVTSQPLEVEDAKEALRKAVPYFDSYLDKGQIEIISYTCLHVTGKIYDSERVINYWIEKVNNVLKSGYRGLRLSGNTSWLEKKDWSYFVDYMEKMDGIISKYQMIALGSYFVDKCSTTNIVEVVSNHQFSLSKQDGKWKKTGNLGRKKAEETAFRAVKYWEHTFDAVPDLIAIIDTKYRIVHANIAMAAKLRLTKEECIGLTSYSAFHGTCEPPTFCPYQQLLNDELEHTAEIYEYNLGGYFIVTTTPLHDPEGKLVGGIYIAHDISERKVAEDELRRNEQLTIRKLVCLPSPVRKVKNLVLADIIDVKVIQSLMNDFYKLAHIPMGLNDLKGNVLVSVGWQDICTKFHRVHPEASKYCVESDTKLTLDSTPGKLKMYECKNNMWDIVTPIMLDGQPVGYVFSGQFIFDDKPLNYEFFRSQARKYSFNEEEYIAALDKVPRLSKEDVNTSMTFLMTFANALSQLSYSNFKLAQSLAELDVLVNELQESEKRFHTMANAIPQLAWIAHPDGYIYWYNERWYSYTGTTLEQMEGWGWQSVHDPGMLPKILEQWKASIATGQIFDTECLLRGVDGIFRPFLTRVLPLQDPKRNILQWFGTCTDITERKQMEETLKVARDSLEEKVKERTEELDKAYNLLKESEKRLSEAQRIAHIGNWDWNILTNKLYWSDEIYRIFGLSPQEFGADYDAFLRIIHPEDRKYVNNAVKEALNRKKSYDIDHRVISNVGKERVVHQQGEVTFDENNNPIRMVGTVQDITEQKKAEVKIQRLANIVESSNDAILTLSLDGIIITWNKGAEQIYGYLSKEILGKNVSILAPDNLKDETKNLIEKVKLGENIQHYTTSRLRKDDKLIYASITLSPVFDSSKKLVAISAITRDITESKKAGDALRESEARFKAYLENSSVIAWMKDEEGRHTFLSSNYEKRFGINLEDWRGKTDLDRWPLKNEERFIENDLAVLKSGKQIEFTEKARNPDGSTSWWLTSKFQFVDFSGKRYIGGLGVDITERKKAEEMLKYKLEELARSNEELERFAYVSSHDLQEPLWMITGYLQLLQSRYQGKLDDKANKYINFAVDGAFGMQNLINDLLKYSRVTTITRELEFTNCEFILKQVLSNLKMMIKENKATVSHDPLPEVMADSSQLVQIFQNLIINGIKFHREEAPKIHISAEKNANGWLFSVQDNGIGIDPQHFKKIFEIFKRLHKREEYSGTGIGLAICEKIVEGYGGRIWVESEVGKGSIFYFTLPINSTDIQKLSFNT